MQSSSVPSKFGIPFANAAGTSYIRTIPQASQIGVTAGAASLTDGFPPVCFSPVAAGGTPPWGADMNGILKQITQWNQWQQAGGPIVYDSTFQTAIGGYPKGAVVQLVVGGAAFMSTVENNTATPAIGATGWMPAPVYGDNVTTVTATGTLTASNAGLVLVNAGSGNITVTMPAVASISGVPLPFNIIRVDSSGNTVAVTAAGSDKFLPTNSSSLSIAAGASLAITGDGVSSWRQDLTGLNNVWTGNNSFSQPVAVASATTSGDAVNLGQFLSAFSTSTGVGSLQIPVIYSGSPITLIVQWFTTALGSAPAGGGTASLQTWPTPFPTACLQAWATADMTGWSQNTAASGVYNVTKTNLGVTLGNYGTVTQSGNVRVIGIGY